MAFGMISATFWFGLFLIAHWLLFHFCRVQRRTRAIAMLFAAAVIASLLTSALATTKEPSFVYGFETSLFLGLFSSVVVMACLYVLYMPAYYTIATSISVQSLVLLSAKSRLGRQNLEDHFASREMAQARLDTMSASGYLTTSNGHYSLTAKGRLVARFFSMLKRLWRLGAGG